MIINVRNISAIIHLRQKKRFIFDVHAKTRQPGANLIQRGGSCELVWTIFSCTIFT